MKLRKNFFYQFGYQILSILLPLATAPYVSRVLHAEGVGVYTYTYTVAYYFYVACMLGFDTHGQRLIAQALDDREKRSRAYSEVLTLQIITTLIASFIYIPYALNVNETIRLVSLIQYIYLASAFINVPWLFEGVEEFKGIAIRNTAVKAVSFVLIFLFVKYETDLWIYALIMGASVFCGNIFFILSAKKHVDFYLPEKKSVIRHLKPAFILFIPQIGITVFMQMDKLMLGWWSTSRQLGYYQNAEKIINIPVALILTVGVVIMPRIISLKAEGRINEVKRYNSISFDLLMLIGIGCTFGLIGTAPTFVPWFFGEDFKDSASILAMLSAQIAFMTWENVIQKQYLVPFEQDRVVVKAMMIGAVSNAGLNIVLIREYGALGAIIASLLAHLIICIYEGWIIRKELPIMIYLFKTLILCIPGAFMTFFVRYLGDILKMNYFLVLVIQISAGIIIYLMASILLLKVMHSDAIAYIMQSILKRTKG